MLEEDARFSLKEIASRTSISEGSVYAILKDHRGYRKKCEIYKNCDSRVISNLLTGDTEAS